MANLTLELNINSASDLKHVNYITKMNVYAVITLEGNKHQKKQKMKTAVDRSGGSNPNWNHAIKFFVNERLALEGRLTLVVRLFSKRILGDKDIGSIEVSLLDLLRLHTQSTSGNSNNHGMRFVTYQVKTTSKKLKGHLTFSYRFNGAHLQSGHGYHQAPTCAIPSQHVYRPYGYIPPPPPPDYGYQVYGFTGLTATIVVARVYGNMPYLRFQALLEQLKMCHFQKI
ncbi:PREDICTED: protein SRC2-like [Camelina sativa]|uniref:Protein SRC2-like n=1 Tax=Camelina sativa TaxID=90675 RepID=A0ABM0V693_CAMSA|nr:PREDICTED: protein SRC2-like [Camelina sativa]